MLIRVSLEWHAGQLRPRLTFRRLNILSLESKLGDMLEVCREQSIHVMLWTVLNAFVLMVYCRKTHSSLYLFVDVRHQLRQSYRRRHPRHSNHGCRPAPITATFEAVCVQCNCGITLCCWRTDPSSSQSSLTFCGLHPLPPSSPVTSVFGWTDWQTLSQYSWQTCWPITGFLVTLMVLHTIAVNCWTSS